MQYDFPATRTFQKARVFWFDDGPDGGCRVPTSWKIQVKIGGSWADVEPNGDYTTVKGGWSEVAFKPLGGTQVRLVAELQRDWSAGILEWEME